MSLLVNVIIYANEQQIKNLPINSAGGHHLNQVLRTWAEQDIWISL